MVAETVGDDCAGIHGAKSTATTGATCSRSRRRNGGLGDLRHIESASLPAERRQRNERRHPLLSQGIQRGEDLERLGKVDAR